MYTLNSCWGIILVFLLFRCECLSILRHITRSGRYTSPLIIKVGDRVKRERDVKCWARAFGSKQNAESFYCDACGANHAQWVGRCTSCKEWNTVKVFREARIAPSSTASSSLGGSLTQKLAAVGRARTLSSGKGGTASDKKLPSPWLGENGMIGCRISMGGGVVNMGNPGMMMGLGNDSLVEMNTIDIGLATQRIKLFSDEMNRVLGNGLVKGSVVLLAGEPGIGKSTLLLQLGSSIANTGHAGVVYVSGEENAEQVASRAHRLGLSTTNFYLLNDIDTDNIIDNVLAMNQIPSLIIVDSVQTMRSASCNSGIGSVMQIRECTSLFVQLAKSVGCAVLLVGHVTKSGDVAGPRVLEHMVDTVLYLEGNEKADYRLLRSMKNRFGSTAEVGVFTMSETGLVDVKNPSELFMSNAVISEGMEGSAVAVVMEGSRPVMAEAQCLVSGNFAASSGKGGSPRRTSDGFPIQRLLLICAVIEKRLKISLWNRDVYLNVVGGLRLSEPAADLAIAMTIISSATSTRIRPGVAFIGEVGLSGEIRGGKRLDARIMEAKKMGFKKIIVPSSSGLKTSTLTKSSKKGSTTTTADHSSSYNENYQGVVACETLREAMGAGLQIPAGMSVDEFLKSLSGASKKRFTSSDERSSGRRPYSDRAMSRSNDIGKSSYYRNIENSEEGIVDNDFDSDDMQDNLEDVEEVGLY